MRSPRGVRPRAHGSDAHFDNLIGNDLAPCLVEILCSFEESFPCARGWLAAIRMRLAREVVVPVRAGLVG